MSEISNYIPVSRKIFEHLFWCEDRVYSRFEAWLDILQSARFEDTEQLIGNRLITVKRGQFPVSLRYLAERWKWSTKKVHSFLELLIQAQMVTKETPKETGQTVITVCNYDRYNFDLEKRKHQKKQEGNRKETPGKQEGNEYNKDNKENKEEKESVKEKATRFSPPTVEEVAGYCSERKNSVDAVKFFSFYESKDWFVGKNRMKDWRAAVRTWERGETKSPPVHPAVNYNNNEFDEERWNKANL